MSSCHLCGGQLPPAPRPLDAAALATLTPGVRRARRQRFAVVVAELGRHGLGPGLCTSANANDRRRSYRSLAS